RDWAMLRLSRMWVTAVQDLVWQRWREFRRRIGAELELALARLTGRRAELGLVAVIAIFFMAAGGLPPLVALAGLAAAAAWSALGPSVEPVRNWRAGVARGASPAAAGLGPLAGAAVPAPAVALDDAGYVVHANRLAEELFGTRRRGSHVASMSRDPELLEA